MQGRKRRLFFAALPDDDVREQLAALAEHHHQRLAHRHHPMDLHLTLAFLGMQSYDMYDSIKSVGDSIEGDEFDLVINRVGYWKGPRILWAAPAETPEQLTGLVDSLWDGLEECGLKREERPYRPHVTLQRKARHIEVTEIEPIHWRVREFSLVWSKDNAKPPRYEPMDSWPLYTSM